MECALKAGGSWKRDILVADGKEFQNNDASEVFVKRVNAKEVLLVKEGDKFMRKWNDKVERKRFRSSHIQSSSAMARTGGRRQ